MASFVGLVSSIALAAGVSPAFDYASYEIASVESLVERSKIIAPTTPDGQSLLKPPIRVHLRAELASLPRQCPDELPNLMLKASGISEPPALGWCIHLRSISGTVINLWVQDSIAPFIAEEYSLGDPIEVWALWLFVNASDKKPYFIVNAIGPAIEARSQRSSEDGI